MTAASNDLSDLAARLRREFDASFEAPRPAPPPPTETALIVGFGAARAAIPVSDAAFVARAVTIARHGGGPPGYLGPATVRGRQIPVFAPAGHAAPIVRDGVVGGVIVAAGASVGVACDAVWGVEKTTIARNAADRAGTPRVRITDLLPAEAFELSARAPRRKKDGT